jgi:hypothetical protein
VDLNRSQSFIPGVIDCLDPDSILSLLELQVATEAGPGRPDRSIARSSDREDTRVPADDPA